ncbi:MAG TPA: hypothetical protein VK550_17360 [Polyangiaceae bacterium]|nr:hypothetical protein [Polyangiaceae bacterium]
MNILERAQQLAAETRRVLNYLPPFQGEPTAMRSSARLVPARPTASSEPIIKLTVDGGAPEMVTTGQLYAKLSFASRAKLKTEYPKEYAVAKAANEAEREELAAKLSQAKSMKDRTEILAELAKL